MANTGNGATLVGSVTTTAWSITNIGLGSQPIESLEISDLSSEDFKEYMSGDLADTNELTVTIQWDMSQPLPPKGGAGETWTYTAPFSRDADTTADTAATLVGTGFVTDIEFPDNENETVQEGTITIKLDGQTGPTFTPEAAGP